MKIKKDVCLIKLSSGGAQISDTKAMKFCSDDAVCCIQSRSSSLIFIWSNGGEFDAKGTLKRRTIEMVLVTPLHQRRSIKARAHCTRTAALTCIHQYSIV